MIRSAVTEILPLVLLAGSRHRRTAAQQAPRAMPENAALARAYAGTPKWRASVQAAPSSAVLGLPHLAARLAVRSAVQQTAVSGERRHPAASGCRTVQPYPTAADLGL